MPSSTQIPTTSQRKLERITQVVVDLATQVRALQDRVDKLEEGGASQTSGISRPSRGAPSPSLLTTDAHICARASVARVASTARPGLWCLYTDGGARPTNPGPSGAGMVLVDPSGTVIWESSVWLGTGTNNSAEYEAVALGVAHVVMRFGKILGGPLLVRSDSKLVLNCLSGKWKCRSTSLGPVYNRAKKAINALPHGWKPEWVRGHDGNKFNERADKLATQGCYGLSSSKQCVDR